MAEEAAQEETTTEEAVAVLAVEDLAAKEAVVSEVTEAQLQDAKAVLEATVAFHQTDLQEEAKVFLLTDQEEKADFLKEHQDVLMLRDHLMLQDQEDQEETNIFS